MVENLKNSENKIEKYPLYGFPAALARYQQLCVRLLNGYRCSSLGNLGWTFSDDLYVKRTKCTRRRQVWWSKGRKVGPDHVQGSPRGPTDGPDIETYIFWPKSAFDPEKNKPPRIFAPNLVRILCRTSPPIIGGPHETRPPLQCVAKR